MCPIALRKRMMLLSRGITRGVATVAAAAYPSREVAARPTLRQAQAGLLLVVHDRACELLTLGIGSARGHRSALAVVGYDNPTGSRDVRALFTWKSIS